MTKKKADRESARYKFGVIIYYDLEDCVFYAEALGLPGCMIHGDTHQEALSKLLDLVPDWIAMAEEAGWEIPVAAGKKTFENV